MQIKRFWTFQAVNFAGHVTKTFTSEDFDIVFNKEYILVNRKKNNEKRCIPMNNVEAWEPVEDEKVSRK